MSARLDSAAVLGQAGDFTAGTQQIVLCDDGTVKESQGCPSYQSVEFIEHSALLTSNTIAVKWTAPPSNAGTVTVYVTAVAANGDQTENGDRTYSASLQLCPVTDCTAPSPSIFPGRVSSASGFSAKAGCAPGTWLEIYGSHLASVTQNWSTSDFKAGIGPTSLANVSVSIGGKNAYVDYVSSGQVNVQVPDGIPIGPAVPLVLTNGSLASVPYMLQTVALAPALLAPNQSPFNANGRQYVVAQLPDQTFAGLPAHAAKPGQVLTLYGIGFGPVTPATPAGTIAPPLTTLANPVMFLFGSTQANVVYRGLSPGLVGLYQFNVVVPNLSPGDYTVTVQAGDVTAIQDVWISIGN